ncbi:TonB-dependent receptor [Croceibacterium sp. TMG7-5b_MA50]|uniref:TonB-dependent receptor n=1 Tax=Croceibacterium sp. TMG7-5b_MA50 TaxID=3121290 RepID=UPI0032214305
MAALPVNAQTSTDAAATRPTTEGLEVITVTAQRWEQSAQDVPIALTVIGGEELERRNIQTVSDLENSVPSLEVDAQFGGGQPQFRLRGVGGTDYAANNTNTVGVYVDEVALPYGVMTQGALFDIERIEVLRGPQGTLYGRNTTGGAISVITGSPTRDLRIGASLSYGRFNQFDAEGYVSGPVSNTLSARIAISSQQGGAWQRDRDTGEELGDRDRNSVRAKLRWEPSAITTVDLQGDYSRDKSDGRGLQLLNDFTDASGRFYPPDTDHRATGWGISGTFAGLLGVGTDAKPFRNNEGWGTQLRVNSDLDWGTLTAIVAHRDFTRREFNDWDATSSNEAGTYFFNDIDVESGEIRFASRQDRPFRWLVGAYQSFETVDGGFLSDFTQAASLRNIFSTSYNQEVSTTAGFGNVEYDVASTLTFSGGLRFEHETRSLNGFRTEVIFPAYQLRATSDRDLDMDEWSGRAALDWQFSPVAHAYASISRGVKSGGFTTYNTGIPSQNDPYDPETLVAYEAGLKSNLLDNRVQLNLTGFYYDYRDYQLQGVIYTGASRVGRITNAPRAHLYGAEVELTAAPVDGLTIVQNFAYKMGEFDEYMAATSATLDPATGQYTNIQYEDYNGRRLNLPKIDYKGSVAWAVPLADWTVTPEVNWNYRSERWSESDASTIPAYWLANANLSVTPPGEAFAVTLWVRNLFDEQVQETRNRFISARTVSTNPVRTFGVRLNYSY